MKKIYIIVIALAALFSTYNCHAQNFDFNTLQTLESTRTPGMNQAMSNVSFSAYIVSPIVPISMLSVGLLTSNADLSVAGAQVGAGLLLSFATTYVTKKIVERPRPYISYPDDLNPLEYETSYSFPSGHTSTAFATATSLSLQFRKWYITIPAFIWAGTVAYSRMYLGVHYPSDVIVGILVGVASSYLTYKIQQWLTPNVQVPLTIKL